MFGGLSFLALIFGDLSPGLFLSLFFSSSLLFDSSFSSSPPFDFLKKGFTAVFLRGILADPSPFARDLLFSLPPVSGFVKVGELSPPPSHAFVLAGFSSWLELTSAAFSSAFLFTGALLKKDLPDIFH